jgi:hypothetical protein
MPNPFDFPPATGQDGTDQIAIWTRDTTGTLTPRRQAVALIPGALTVATLPSAATAGAGTRAFVTDANATTFNSTVAAGGSNKVPVVSDGTNWLIG